MYNLLMDSDALIKLVHSGALIKTCESFNCVATSEIKRETVDDGKKKLYQDAEVIEKLIEDRLLKIRDPKKLIEPNERLGKGELSILSLGREIRNHIVVSDDQKFIKILEEENIDFLVPIDLIALLYRLKKISQKEAKSCMEKIKIFVRGEDYEKLRNELEGK